MQNFGWEWTRFIEMKKMDVLEQSNFMSAARLADRRISYTAQSKARQRATQRPIQAIKSARISACAEHKRATKSPAAEAAGKKKAAPKGG